VSVAEVRPGVYRLEQPDGRRRLCQVVVVGQVRTLAVDAGLPESPEQGLLPLLTSLGLERRPVVLVLTHPDADHRGGAAVLRDALPELEIWGQELDGAQLSDPEVALAERYLAFAASDGLGPAPDHLARMRARLGRPIRLDRVVSGDTSIDLGARRVQILHMPGHSPGSLVAWLPDERAAVIGDAVMGRGIPFFDGSVMYPPMYAPPATYLETISRLEALRPSLILSGHEPLLEGDETMRFLTESRTAANRLSALVRDALADGSPRTLADVCAAVADGYGGLPGDGATSLAMTVDGTLGELVERREAELQPGVPRRFRAVR
jgi:glyoxylase-like metal-dependent hydrolase (beta-lactamase superfamily II)